MPMPSDGSKPTGFTFGCMSLGSDLSLLEDHVRVARQAMEARVWFHASPTYHRGFTYMVLRLAFDEARREEPPMIIKIRCGTARLLRFEVEDTLRRLGIERISLAQLVFTESGPDPLVQDHANDGPIAQTCADLKREGKVAAFAPQCDHRTSQALLPLAQRDCFDGFVLYLNPLQRDADEALWQVLQQRSTPLWALRTLAGALGDPDRLEAHARQHPDDPRVPLAQRIIEIARAAGCADWTEFCMRYACSVPHVCTTIGGTANPAHLKRLLDVHADAKPLPAEVMQQVDAARHHVKA